MLNSIKEEYDKNKSVIENCIDLLTTYDKLATLEHVRKVSETGVFIANKYGLDESKVKIACYLHDISVIIPKDNYIGISKEHDISVIYEEEQLPMLLHQKISRLIAKEVFGIVDPDILSSIECHTTLKNSPSLIDMTVFIADKLSWDKNGVPPFYNSIYKSVCEESLEDACFKYIEFCFDYNMILIPHPMLIEAREHLKKIKGGKNEKIK